MGKLAGHAKHPGHRPHGRGGRRRGPPRRRGGGCPSRRAYALGPMAGAYAAAVAFTLAVAALVPPALLIAYPAAGIYLSRKIDGRIVWWNQADSIQNVSSAKLNLILTWPLSVPVFLFRVFVAKYL